MSEEIYRRLSCTVKGSIHIYIYIKPTIALCSPIHTLNFILALQDDFTSLNVTYQIIGAPLRTSDQRWRVCAGGWDSCMAMC